MQELNTSYQNLKNQRKFLATSEFLYANKKPYQNQGMADRISDTKDLILTIENARDKINNYTLFCDLITMLDRLTLNKDSMDYEYILDWIDHSNFVSMFGGDCAGPEVLVTLNPLGSNPAQSRRKVWYADDGSVIREQQLFP